MEKQRHLLAGTTLLALALVLVACGQGQVQDQGPATLEVACVPPAEIYIDGTSVGTTPQKLTLDAGEHSVVLKRELFEDHEAKVELKSGTSAAVDVSLYGSDPGDPEVIRILNEVAEIEQEPFEEGERHRGGGSDEMAVLLWPKKDVRMDGLSVYGIEVSLDYMGDGHLEFKKGRKVLYREPFEPERVTTVAPIPATVREALDSGDSVTWGLVFEKKRDNVTSKFKVVKGGSAATALEKLERRKFYKRQPPLTQALMRAQVLHNKRLYTEALLANLAAAQAFPTSTQPYQGIVTSLRRMDSKDSELWVVASRFVQGSGAASRLRKGGGPGKIPPPGGAPPVANWSPGSGAVRGEPNLLGAGDGVTPGLRPVPEQPTPPTATDPSVTGPETTQPTPPAPGGGNLGELRESARRLEAELREPRRAAEEAQQRADDSAAGARHAREASESATRALREAEQRAAAAEEAHNADPTPENQDALTRAQHEQTERSEQAGQAREQADRAQREAEQAANEARRLDREIQRREQALQDLYDQIAQAGGAPAEPTPGNRRGSGPTAGTGPGGTGPSVTGPGANRRGRRDEAMSRQHTDARNRYQEGQTELGAARTILTDLEARALEMLKAKDESKDPVMDDAYNEVLREMAEVRTQLEQHEAQAQDREKQYIESLRGMGGGDAQVAELTTRMNEQEAAVADARAAVTAAEEAFQQDTFDTARMEELAKARARLKEAEAVLSQTLAAVEAAIGDGD